MTQKINENLTGATIGEDLLRGADEIALFLYGDRNHRRKVYYNASGATAGMPVFRIGSVICARKSKLLAWIELQESGQ